MKLNKKQKELLTLMQEVNMNESTITGVLKLLKTEEKINQTIDYIKKMKDIITDHQLRQYMMDLLVWSKE